MSREEVRAKFGVDYQEGERLSRDGKPGTLVSFPGDYLGIQFDGEMWITRCHPLWRIERIEEESNDWHV